MKLWIKKSFLLPVVVVVLGSLLAGQAFPGISPLAAAARTLEASVQTSDDADKSEQPLDLIAEGKKIGGKGYLRSAGLLKPVPAPDNTSGKLA